MISQTGVVDAETTPDTLIQSSSQTWQRWGADVDSSAPPPELELLSDASAAVSPPTNPPGNPPSANPPVS
jgi:hypothetical protein